MGENGKGRGMSVDDIGNHMSPEEVERYSLGELSDAESALFDEHLLICDSCRVAVEASDAYVQAMRAAAGKIRSKIDTKAGVASGK
jgi:anti-sigma factor RsiW